ncbi:hypothetical protein RM780_00025 [Streptomyces sp. DSM 44917]|uniref:Uncharacterized protein n=1 Tax=Streptomyces boetiae TaxID=3075541 RepID=A0ABU2L1I1_9ACTN|nr:hypothetical protein [Streptomyces sp. DSM 44917]MDT0305352.1 hypothetical protein [Streptomyces sp. DSM 44917]
MTRWKRMAAVAGLAVGIVVGAAGAAQADHHMSRTVSPTDTHVSGGQAEEGPGAIRPLDTHVS